MNNEQWQLFSDQVTLTLTTNQPPLTTHTSESLESTWHKIQNSIISAALQHISNKNLQLEIFNTSF